jgi:phosphoglycolate phosphatase
LFDFDGTLVHTAPGILSCFRQVLADAGIPPAEPVDERVIGPPLLETLRRLSGVADQERLARLAGDFTAIYDTSGVLGADPYPGLGGTLDALAAKNRRSFIVTNKRHVAARLIADRLGITKHCVALYSRDALTPPAPTKAIVVAQLIADHAIDPRAAVLVGDSVEDATAAAEHGIRFVAVTYGYGNPFAGNGATPAATLECIADLPAVLSRLE